MFISSGEMQKVFSVMSEGLLCLYLVNVFLEQGKLFLFSSEIYWVHSYGPTLIMK